MQGMIAEEVTKIHCYSPFFEVFRDSKINKKKAFKGIIANLLFNLYSKLSIEIKKWPRPTKRRRNRQPTSVKG